MGRIGRKGRRGQRKRDRELHPPLHRHEDSDVETGSTGSTGETTDSELDEAFVVNVMEARKESFDRHLKRLVELTLLIGILVLVSIPVFEKHKDKFRIDVVVGIQKVFNRTLSFDPIP